MAFIRHKGKTKTMWYPRPASQVFTKGDLVYPNTSGQVIPADATSGRHVGVIKKTVATTDDDYATVDEVLENGIRHEVFRIFGMKLKLNCKTFFISG